MALGFKEDDKYNLSEDKIEKFCMEHRLIGKTFYWDEVINKSNNKNNNVYNPLEFKYVKCDQDIPMHQNRKT